MTVHICASKTDPFRAGVYVRVGATGDNVCPVASMVRYRAAHPLQQGLLFIFSCTHFLTRQDMVTMLSRCLPGTPGINTHSFRIGGASAAASAGIPNSTIQILGRWSSDSYRRYLRMSDNMVISLSQRICRVHRLHRFGSQDSLSSRPSGE